MKGGLLGAGPCILGKIVSGAFLGPDKWVVGFAMVIFAAAAAAAPLLLSLLCLLCGPCCAG